MRPAGASADIVALLAPHDQATRVRLAAPADAPFLRDLYVGSRRNEFAASGLPSAALAQLLDQQVRTQAASYAAHYPDAISLVILHREAPVGRLIVAPGVLDWRIVDIAVLTSARGSGIGSGVIDAVLRAATAQGARRVRLAVLSSNHAARRLYERLGFIADEDDGARIAMVRPLA